MNTMGNKKHVIVITLPTLCRVHFLSSRWVILVPGIMPSRIGLVSYILYLHNLLSIAYLYIESNKWQMIRFCCYFGTACMSTDLPHLDMYPHHRVCIYHHHKNFPSCSLLQNNSHQGVFKHSLQCSKTYFPFAE